uniref:GrpE protein homolog n=1 Tax=Kalanchoe fedtschenkoi TaxID=63787 RepID=A0A7N0VLB5_KALFE
MSVVSRVLSRFSKGALPQFRISFTAPVHQQHISTLCDIRNKAVTRQMSYLHNLNASFFRRHGFSSTASSETTVKEASNNGSENAAAVENGASVVENSAPAKPTEDLNDESDAEEELSVNDLVKLVTEKDELLQTKQKEIEAMKDKFLRSYAEMENVMQRSKREAENSKKFAIQSFAKGLLDVADNLGRASSVVKESFSKIDTEKDASAVVPLLKTLLEGVEMTEKQLQDVFKKAGIEKYEPVDEQFDPNRHNAVFQVPDAAKPADTVAVVLKAGYMLHDRVLRPAEVGVRVAANRSE